MATDHRHPQLAQTLATHHRTAAGLKGPQAGRGRFRGITPRIRIAAAGTTGRDLCATTSHGSSSLGRYDRIARPVPPAGERDTGAAPTTLTEPRHTGRRLSPHAWSLAPTRSAFEGAGRFGRIPSCSSNPHRAARALCRTTNDGSAAP
jgi:hypothetical protein